MGRLQVDGPIADRIIKFETQAIGIFREKFAVSDPGIGGEIAAKGADHEVLIGLPEFFAGDASTVTTDVDGLRHFEAAVVGERQTEKRAHGDAVFIAAACGDSRQSSRFQIVSLRKVGPGGPTRP